MKIDETHTVDDRVKADVRTLGHKLKEAREYLGLSQEIVANHLDIPRASVSALESGRRKLSSTELMRFSTLYRRPVTFFLEQSDEPVQTENEPELNALYRATRELSSADREQVIKFAQFLRHAGNLPKED